MANTTSSKGNPAGKRMRNEKRKAKRAASWKRAQERKETEKKRVAEAEKRNKHLKAQGLPTPHQATAARLRDQKVDQ